MILRCTAKMLARDERRDSRSWTRSIPAGTRRTRGLRSRVRGIVAVVVRGDFSTEVVGDPFDVRTEVGPAVLVLSVPAQCLGELVHSLSWREIGLEKISSK